MQHPLRIGILGDYDPTRPTHAATDAAIGHVAASLNVPVEARWFPTPQLVPPVDDLLRGCAAIWCAPGSPYAQMQGALDGIAYARRNGIPFLGTCAGFQHAVIEFARNVLGFADAQHAEYDADASLLFVNELSCSLLGETMPIRLEPESRAFALYGTRDITEQYYCRFGVNPAYQDLLHQAGLRIAGRDDAGEARILELEGHPFFVATLFVPQQSSTPARPHPLIRALVQHAVEYADAVR